MTTQTTTTISAKTPEEVLDAVRQKAQAHAKATEAFVNEFSFYGRTLREHSDALWIEVPDKPTPEQIREIYIRLIVNIQVASQFLSAASSIHSALMGGGAKTKADIVAAIVDDYKRRGAKRPAGTVIDKMAESYMSDTNSVTVAAKIVKDFWKTRYDALIEVRKMMEQIQLSLVSELKYLEHSQ